MTTKIKFINKSKSEFFPVLKQRVDAYFEKNNLSPKANGQMIAKVCIILLAYYGSYALIMSGVLSLWGMFAAALFLGFAGALVGFNVGHDAIHGSFSSKPWVNKLVAYNFYAVGANPYLWNITHNIVHHTFTNIPGVDEDLDQPLVIRLSPDKPKWKIHRFQHIYAFFLYGFASISWVFTKDYRKFFQKQIGNYDNSKHPVSEYVKLFGFKILYYIVFIALPLYFLPITWWQFAIGFVAMHLVQGLTLALVFQLAHIVEGTHFPEPDTNGHVESAWAIHQMNTTANFARKSPVAFFICGGLNFQVEHHLFPKVCHIHYPEVSEIVKNTAEEYGVPYLESPTFWSAVTSHYRMLQFFGSEESAEIPSGMTPAH
jgi:linoleoyl-CoA desaturase